MTEKNDRSILLRESSDGITTLTLNRPQQRNALSVELMSALCAALNDLAGDKTQRVVILRGNGPAFCAGHDLKEMRADPGKAAQEKTFNLCAEMMLGIVSLPQPVIAEVQGIATAAGCQLVASCDLAIASDSARFATPGVNLGLFCSTPMVALSRNLSRKHALEMLLTGDMIDADKAVEFGLVNRAVAAGDLSTEVRTLAEKINAKSPLALRTGKAAFYQQLEMGLKDAYAYTSAVMVQNMLEKDAAEGIDAFIEKRKPSWSDS